MSYGVLPVTFKFRDMEPLTEIWGYYMKVLPRSKLMIWRHDMR